MHRISFISVAFALAASLTGGLAQAHGPAVQWVVTVGPPALFFPPPPPPPAFRPRYGVVVVPAPVVVQYPVYRGHHGWRDSDRDGIPDRYDRVDNRRWDRDRDGIPNRWDRYDNRDDNRHDHRPDGWRGR